MSASGAKRPLATPPSLNWAYRLQQQQGDTARFRDIRDVHFAPVAAGPTKATNKQKAAENAAVTQFEF